MRVRLLSVMLGVCAILCAGATRPAFTDPNDWFVDDFVVSGTPVSTSGSAAGYSPGYTVYAYATSDVTDPNGTSGGGTLNISQEFQKIGPSNLTVKPVLAVSGSATAGSYGGQNPTCYSQASSYAQADPTDFQNAYRPDGTATAQYPSGPTSDSYSLNNSRGAPTRTLSANAILGGTIYFHTGGSAANNGTGLAETDASLSFNYW